jgi:iron complex outermembrane receptor protein
MSSRIRRHRAIAFGLLALAGKAACAEDGMMQLPEVTVTGTQSREGSAERGYGVDQVQVGHMGTRSLKDTPYALTVVSADLMANTQAANVTQALKYVPTVYANSGSSQVTPYFTLRGFIASQTSGWNTSVDGMRSWDIYQPVEDKDRIVVMPGATGFVNGVTSPAGMIDYVLKRPTSTALAELTVGTLDRQVYGHLDLGGPIAGRDDLAYRLNVVYGDDGDTGTEHQTQQRQSLSGALDWRLTPDTRLSLDAAYAKRHVDYAQSVFMFGYTPNDMPKAFDAAKNRGAPYDHAYDESTRIGVALESRLNDIFSLRAQVRHSDIEREYRWSRVVWQSAALKYKWRIDAQDPFDIAVDQYAAFVDASFATGPLAHKLTVGVSHDDYDKGYDVSYTGTTGPSGGYVSDYGYPAYTKPALSASSAQRTKYDTVLLADRIAIGPRWELMLGVNDAHIDDKAYARKIVANAVSNIVSVTPYSSGRTTPAATLAFKPTPALTAYASYLETLQPGFISTSVGNKGTLFAPTVGKQNEIGAKAAWGDVMLTAAWFRIDQANQYTDPTTQVSNQDGREVHKGWEFSATGRVTSCLTLVGGFTLLDAKVEKATANVGKIPQGVPERMARLYAEFDLPFVAGLTVTGGLSYTGRTPWDAGNAVYVDAVTVTDAGLRYRTLIAGKEVVFRGTISNLIGKDYWTTRSGILYFGEPRTLALSASVHF